MNCIKCKGTTSVVDSRPQETSAIKIRIKKPKIKPRNPFNDDAYLDSLSDDELEALIGGEEFETYR